ncbi:MAG: hypothetical protein HY400_00895, partial [Elusimicrobia bacterium]|nr:hypothetical protein [Elusimicrobiota bacterium]
MWLARARIVGACLLYLLAAHSVSSAAPAFELESGIRLSSGTPQQILAIGGGVSRMYFVRDKFQVLSATSSNKIDWVEESGVRLSTSPAPSVDASSITACAVFSLNAGGFRMVYSAVSSTGAYSILSATSTDGLAWFKESGFRLHFNGGLTYLASPRVFKASSSLLRMYYVQDSAGGNSPSNYVVQSASSTDEGLNWSVEGTRLSTPTAEVSVSTLTNGNYRMFYSQLQSATTVSLQILSAVSSDGLTFTFDSLILSTSSASGQVGFPVVERSTETFRWRLYYAFTPSGSTIPVVNSALTTKVAATSFSPLTTLTTTATTAFTLTGEIFGATPTVRMVQGVNSITATGVVTQTDMQLTGNFYTLNAPKGLWDIVVTNPDGSSATLSNNLLVDVPAGIVGVTDNLFRPRLSQQAQIDVTTFDSGRVTLKIYTSNGELVTTLLDEEKPTGSFSVFWNGKTSLGNTVASGVYILHASGPKLNDTKK